MNPFDVILLIFSVFGFAVPKLSWFVAFLLFLAWFLLRLIPLRIILLIFGLYKFLKRLLRPHVVPNNEILDLLSRVPNDEEMIMYRELSLVTNTEGPNASGNKKDQRKKLKLN